MVAATDQLDRHSFYCQLLLFSSLPTYFITRYIITAPFGRRVSSKTSTPWWYGPKLNARISWFLFECPNLFWSWYWCWYRCDKSILFLDANDSPANKFFQINSDEIVMSTNALLVGLFTLHYVNRAIIYPLRMNKSSQPVPMVVIASAVMFTALNGHLQCFYLGHIEKLPAFIISKSEINIHTMLGVILFFIGMAINMQSDGVLRNLRLRNKDKKTPNTRRYYIPKGALFTYISCPNFTGEIIEWFGFASASHFSLSSIAFVCYTASNLIPRGIAHHKWYKDKFDNYPDERKWAVIPFIV